MLWTPSSSIDFYPRPPRGGRLISTSAPLIAPSISIHALREEGDERNQLTSIKRG